MKGLKTIIILVIGLFCLTGCGEKKLVCTSTENEDGIRMDQEITVTYKEDQVTNVKLNLDATATEEAQEYWAIFTSVMDAQFNDTIESGNEEGVQINMDTDDDNYRMSFSMEFDLTKVSNKVMEEYSIEEIVDSNATIEEIKANMEADGYTCN